MMPLGTAVSEKVAQQEPARSTGHSQIEEGPNCPAAAPAEVTHRRALAALSAPLFSGRGIRLVARTVYKHSAPHSVLCSLFYKGTRPFAPLLKNF